MAEYLVKYRAYLHIAEDPDLPRIAGARLQKEVQHAAASAAAWGQWEHDEWAALPLEAVEWLARLLACVEASVRWSTQTMWGKAVCLS